MAVGVENRQLRSGLLWETSLCSACEPTRYKKWWASLALVVVGVQTVSV